MSAVIQQLIPWGAYLPYHVAQDLGAHPGLSPVGREQRMGAVVLFADIWGFTAISEALATGGPGGAEELTDLLNATFTPLIALAESYGGMLGSFGGDALTALFPYEAGQRAPTARRAVAAALAMQAHLARAASLRTGAGTFRLAMRAGLAAGPLLCTSVGDPAQRLEPLIAGAVLARAAAAERSAQPGEVAICADLHDDLGPEVMLERRSPAERRLRAVAWAGPDRRSVSDRRAAADERFFIARALTHQPPPCPLPPLEPLPAAALPLAEAFLPPTIARRLSDGQDSFINEHRAVSVIFAAFAGPNCDDDPQAGRLLQGYLGQIFAIVGRYDGYVNKIAMGDKGSTILILFGAPLAHEDDADRALHCALEIRGVAAPAGPAGAIRVGVAGGLVFSGQVGSATRREYTVIGDTVNVASRLMQHAEPGQILVTEASRRAAGPDFDWDEPQELQLRGRAARIGVVALAGAGSGGEARPIRAAPLVGRGDELAYLHGRLAMALAGRGALVGLAGEAGLGKSALAADLLAAAGEGGATCLTGECISYRASSSYLVWQRPLRQLFGIMPGWGAERAARQLERQLAAIDPRVAARMPLLGSALGLSLPDNKLTAGLDGELRKGALERMLQTCIAHLAARRPLLIVLESCDWIDPLSRDLLECLTQGADELPLLILLTYRGGVGADAAGLPRPAQLAHFAELRLAELDHSAAVALIGQTVGRLFGPQATVPPALAQAIVARAGGNPFYIEEILSLLHSRGVDLSDAEAVARVELPDSLISLVISRIDQLAEGAQTALKVASVIGQEFTPAWLAGVHPPLGSGAALGPPLDELRQHNMAVLDRAGPDPHYLFRHVITREAAYGSLARATRAGLHERAGAYIEQAYAGDIDQQLDLLAYHYGLSDNQIKQSEYFARAGAAAQAAFASEAAIGFYSRLLPLLSRHERSEVLQQIGRALCHAGRWDEAEARYGEALECAPSTAIEAVSRRLLGELRLRRGDFAGARGWLEQSRALCAAADDRMGESAALHQLGMVAWSQGDARAALAQLQRSLELGADDDRGRSTQTLNNIGLVHWSLGDHGRALDCFERCLRLAAGTGNRQQIGVAIGNMGNVYLARGDYGRALECYSQKLQYALDVGDSWEIGISIGNIGHIYEAQGEYGRAEACQLRSLAIALDLGDQLGVGVALLGLGALAAARGAPAAAGDLYGRADAVLGTIDAAYELGECRYGQAELAARDGDQRRARMLLAEALALAEASHHHEVAQKCHILQVESACALGQISPAAAVGELVDQLAERATDEGRAALHYAIVRIDGARAADRTAAARLYRALHARTPHAEYRRRYAELMGVALPPPPPLPPLPAVVGEGQASLGPLLAGIDALIARASPA